MAYKDLGSGVSQKPQLLSTGDQFSAEQKSYESVVVQEDAPMIDWEMNLRSEIKSDYGLRLVTQKSYPSCFLTSDFLENTEPSNSFEFLTASVGNENKFILKACDAIVNGWPVHIEYSDTNTDGENEITLSVPSGAGVRTDLVILEVWRALVKAAPDTANKSPTSLILRNGNVKAPDTVNLTDDLIDPTYAAESQARVQIQYRLRVIDGVDAFTYPDILDDPAIVAHTVSDFSGPGADGSATAFQFAVADHDKSLWIAGTGTVGDANALGTVDGFMYAIPVCVIARRNDGAFDQTLNLNGGSLIVSASSTRPDGLFSDQIVASDVKDLRKGCSNNPREILEQATAQLFNNSLSTELEVGLKGTAGTSFLEVSSIGFGERIGNTDTARRRFSDRPYSEVVVGKIVVGGTPQSAFYIDLNNFTISWGAGATGIDTLTPNATLGRINQVRVVDTGVPSDVDLIITGGIRDITYTSPTLAVINTISSYSNVTIYVECVIDYPAGIGVDRNMLSVHDIWVPSAATLGAWVDSSLFVVTPDVTRYSLIPNSAVPPVPMWEEDPAHREVKIQLQSVDQVATFYSYSTNQVWVPDRINYEDVTIDDGINPPYSTGNYTKDTAYTQIFLSIAVPSGTPVQVTYKALRALPYVNSANRVQVFYQTRAIQSLLPPAGSQTLELVPRAIGNLHTISHGSGSPDYPTPFIQPGAQVPVGLLPTIIEAKIDAPAGDLNSGLTLSFSGIQTHIPYYPEPQSVTLHREPGDTVIDGDQRNFWPQSDTADVVVKGTPYIGENKHKTVLPTLMEVKSDFQSVGKSGTFVLVVFTGYNEFEKGTEINLTNLIGDSAAAVYRVRGNFMNVRRSD